MAPRLGKVLDWTVNGNSGPSLVRARAIKIPVGDALVHFHLAVDTGALTHTLSGTKLGHIDSSSQGMPDELCVKLVEDVIEKHSVEYVHKVMVDNVSEHPVEVL